MMGLLIFMPHHEKIQVMTQHQQPLTTTVTQEEALAAAQELLSGMRHYGHLEAAKQPALVAAILLALSSPGFTVEQLGAPGEPGADKVSDGEKIYRAAHQYLESVDLPAETVSTMMEQFAFIKSNTRINQTDTRLDGSLIAWATRITRERLYGYMTDQRAVPAVDMLGYLYRESAVAGGDGLALGIVLTPPHVTMLMADLLDVSPGDAVLEPTAGTGSFRLAAETTAWQQPKTPQNHDMENVFYGVELQDKLFTLATTNMLLRHGSSNIVHGSIFDTAPEVPPSRATPVTEEPGRITTQVFDKILANPPYGLAKNKDTRHLSELAFIERALELLKPGGKLAVIVPQSTIVGKTKDDKARKRRILERNTLEAVITVNPNAFVESGCSPHTVIAVFTGGQPHPADKLVDFVNFETDGWVASRHTGLVDDGTAVSQRAHLFSVLYGETVAGTDVLVRSAITPEDEWHHSYFYFNDTPPTEEDFLNTVADYVSWQVDMAAHGYGHLITPPVTQNQKTGGPHE